MSPHRLTKGVRTSLAPEQEKRVPALTVQHPRLRLLRMNGRDGIDIELQAAHRSRPHLFSGFSSDLRFNPHFHMVVIDGVYRASRDGPPQFRALPPPIDGDVADAVYDACYAASGIYGVGTEQVARLGSPFGFHIMLLFYGIAIDGKDGSRTPLVLAIRMTY